MGWEGVIWYGGEEPQTYTMLLFFEGLPKVGGLAYSVAGDALITVTGATVTNFGTRTQSLDGVGPEASFTFSSAMGSLETEGTIIFRPYRVLQDFNAINLIEGFNISVTGNLSYTDTTGFDNGGIQFVLQALNDKTLETVTFTRSIFVDDGLGSTTFSILFEPDLA